MLLKNVLDGGGDYYTLHKLVFCDITHEDLRARILTHFERQGSGQLTMSRDLKRKSEGPGLQRKILSDIDDTLYCSGGHFPAGADARLPKHTVYPGLLQLFSELDVQAHAAQPTEKTPLAHAAQPTEKTPLVKKREMISNSSWTNIVFLSARPHVYGDVAERASYRLFEQLQAAGQMHTMPALIPGRLCASVCAVVKAICCRRDAWEGAGVQKFESMKDYNRLYPEYECIFFGDNGQGDLLSAELALQHDPPLLSVAFINEVVERSEGLSSFRDLEIADRELRWKELGVVFTKTPVDAAVESLRRGLVSKESLVRVCGTAQVDLQAISVRTAEWPLLGERCDELNASLQMARQLCPEVQLIDKEAFLQRAQYLLDMSVEDSSDGEEDSRDSDAGSKMKLLSRDVISG